MQGIDLSGIYNVRTSFIIVGITGRTGTGCTRLSEKMTLGFNRGKGFVNPQKFDDKHDAYKKYQIVYQYAKENFAPFTLIKYSDVLMFEIIKEGLNPFIEFLQSDKLKSSFLKSRLTTLCDYSNEIIKLKKLEQLWNEVQIKINEISFVEIKKDDNFEKLHAIFFNYERFNQLLSKINKILLDNSIIKRNKALQVIANNLRMSGTPFGDEIKDPENIFKIVILINYLIKAERKVKKEQDIQIVIDSLRNPFEIMFFRQRYAAYYTFATNMIEEEREKEIEHRYKKRDQEDVNQLLEEEYEGGRDYEFQNQKVKTCLQYADIHIAFRDAKQVQKLNKNKKDGDLTSPYYSWEMQLLKYISLIKQPGIITPSPEERCMQLAYTAKYNSGCISRQVGAAITDESYSIKAIGWNNTPEGQAPCVVRDVKELIKDKGNCTTFSPYERSDEFREVIKDHYDEALSEYSKNLKGRNVCFCFKALRNHMVEGKNPVHTRALHAEEGAFLQISKYGGTGIKNGKLFTTASPCELCSKKAYQLGIKVIYYIDPYPGIAKSHILDAGKNPPEIRTFHGAIGSAYHWLYEPIIPYKDELTLLLGLNIPDLTKKQDNVIKSQKRTIKRLRHQLMRRNIKQKPTMK